MSNNSSLAENAEMIEQLWQAARCILALSQHGAIVQGFKKGPIILIDHRAVPDQLEYNKAPNKNQQFFSATFNSCEVTWRNPHD